MQRRVTKTTHTVSKNKHHNKYQDLLFHYEESEDSSSLSVLMEGDMVSAVKALKVIKQKLYDNFAGAGVCNPEDLVSETLLKLWELHQGNQTLGKGIMDTIAREVYRCWLRERSLRAEVQIDFLPEVASPPLASESQESPPSFLEGLLNIAIESLAETDREILLSHILNMVSFEELAELSALSKNGIKVRHYRAIDKLRLAFLKELLSRYRDAA
jgi:RNA polymerase sigma factor (sigma-70 family)